MRGALAACGAPVIASYVLAGGVLTGKYDADPAAGRATGTLESPAVAAAACRRELRELAPRSTPRRDARGRSRCQPRGGERAVRRDPPEQVRQNAAALALDRLGDDQLAALRAIGALGTRYFTRRTGSPSR